MTEPRTDLMPTSEDEFAEAALGLAEATAALLADLEGTPMDEDGTTYDAARRALDEALRFAAFVRGGSSRDFGK